MEPEGSLPHSQVPATSPYPEPARCSPCPHIELPEDPWSILILSSYLHLGLPSGFSLRFPTKTLYNFFFLSYVLHYSPISFFSILSPEQYWARNTDHLASYYVVLSLPCYLVPLRSKYSPQHPILKHSQLTFLPQCERPSFTPIHNSRQNYESVVIKQILRLSNVQATVASWYFKMCPKMCPKMRPTMCPKMRPKMCPKMCSTVCPKMRPKMCPKICPKMCPKMRHKICPKVCPTMCPKMCLKLKWRRKQFWIKVVRVYLPDVFVVEVPTYAEMHWSVTGPQQPTFKLKSIHGFDCADFRETQINQ